MNIISRNLDQSSSSIAEITETLYNVDPKDQLLLINCTSACTLVLPDSDKIINGKTFKIRDISGNAYTNNITVSMGDSTTINNTSATTIEENYGAISIIYVNNKYLFETNTVEEKSYINTITSGDQVGLVGYDANGKLIQGTGSGPQDLQSVLGTADTTGDNSIQFEDTTETFEIKAGKVFRRGNEFLMLGSEARTYGLNPTGVSDLHRWVANDFSQQIRVQHDIDNGDFLLRTDGSVRPDIVFSNGSDEAMRVSAPTSGNALVTIKALEVLENLDVDVAIEVGSTGYSDKWTSIYSPILSDRAAFIGRSGVNEANVLTNTYHDGSFKSIAAGDCTRFVQTSSGQLAFFNYIASAANETITFVERFRINAAGDLTANSATFGDNVTINASEVEINVGDDADGIIDNNAGMRILKTATGSLYYDHKTYTGGSINYRCGEGTERGNVHTFMQVDPTEGDVTFSDKVTIKKAAGNSTLIVGDDTTTATDNLTGLRILARETEGDLYIDHKTKSGKLISYRCGEGAQSASSHTFMQVDPTDGEITFANVNEISDMGLISLRNTSNSSSSDGDFWKEGDFNLLKGETRVIGDSAATLHVGDDVNLATNGQSGIKLQSDSVGHINVDHKTKNSEEIRYRCGANSETGFARTFMEVDPTDGDVTFGANVNVNDGVGIYNNTSNAVDGFINAYTPTVGNLDAVRYTALKQYDTYSKIVAGWAGSGSGTNELRVEVADSSGTEQVTGVFYSDKFILNKGFQQSVDNVAFNVISRNSINPALYVNNAHSGDIQVWQSDPTQTGQGIVARMYNDGSLDLGGVLNLASTTAPASPSTGDIWRDVTFITINDDLKVRSDKPFLELLSTKDGAWTAGERKGAINFYGSDTSGSGPNVHAFIQAQTRDTFGAATELSFGVSDSGSPAVESLRLKATGALNYRPITNTSPDDGDVWRDSADGKLKFRENGVTYNFN
jgi:hypothetical protein